LGVAEIRSKTNLPDRYVRELLDKYVGKSWRVERAGHGKQTLFLIQN
jgi:hypothetical protein